MSAIEALLQQAVYQQLAANAALTAALPMGAASVTARPLADLEAPYVLIGGSASSPLDTQGFAGMDSRIDIHIYSRAGGGLEARQVLALVAAALNAAPEIEGLHIALWKVVESRALTESDGVTTRASLILRVIGEIAE